MAMVDHENWEEVGYPLEAPLQGCGTRENGDGEGGVWK
jgi:hypothetical protein